MDGNLSLADVAALNKLPASFGSGCFLCSDFAPLPRINIEKGSAFRRKESRFF